MFSYTPHKCTWDDCGVLTPTNFYFLFNFFIALYAPLLCIIDEVMIYKTSSCTYWQSSCLFLFKLFSFKLFSCLFLFKLFSQWPVAIGGKNIKRWKWKCLPADTIVLHNWWSHAEIYKTSSCTYCQSSCLFLFKPFSQWPVAIGVNNIKWWKGKFLPAHIIILQRLFTAWQN